MVRILAFYPNREGSRFDVCYYRGSHTKLATRLLEPFGLTAIRILEGIRGLDGGAPAFRVISEMSFSSFEAFERAMAQHGQELFNDLAKCTDLNPTLQVCRLEGDDL